MREPKSRDVLLTGLGVVSPLGCSTVDLVRRFARGERAEIKGGGAYVSEVPLSRLPAAHRVRVGRVDRLCRFFLAASYMALEDADLSIEAGEADRIGISFGTGLGCLLTNEEYNQRVIAQGPAAASPRLFAYTVSSAAAGEVSIALGITGPNLTSHAGLAAGLGAVGYGFELIQTGRADVVLAGGGDVIGEPLLDGLRDMGLLKTADSAHPFKEPTPGIVPAEATVVAILESGDRARRRGVRPWGIIRSYAAGFEPTLVRRRRVTAGIELAIRRALHASGPYGAKIDFIVSSAHGTPIDEVERAALASACGTRALVFAPKTATGDCLGASGTVGLALAVGLLRQKPELADGVAFDLAGTHVEGREASRRLQESQMVIISSLCYSGNFVALVLSDA